MNRGAARVLFVTSELAPWAKSGGLGEVSNDLPRALAGAGLDVRILVPAYPPLVDAFPDAPCVAEFPAPGARFPATRLLHARGPVPIYLVDCPQYYARSGLYQSPEEFDWPDNHLRFGLLSRIAAILGGSGTPLGWRPHVVHCHDWQAGLAPAYLAYRDGGAAATVMTAHNLAFQGVFPPHVLDELGLPREAFTLDGLEYYGNVSFLKAGLSYATQLTTVSRTYAREIQGTELGFGLDALLRRRAGELRGISNGIDREIWNPAHDRYLDAHYDSNRIDEKQANKLALQRELGLPESADTPLLGIVSRMSWQKGLDILLEAAPEIISLGAQIVVHGEGDHGIEHAVRTLADHHPEWIAARIGFDERLNHRIIAGADAFLLPSRYEPCGLTQLHSMHYGTIPIAHRTGGLADWVVDATQENVRARKATGFAFSPLDAATLVRAVERALAAYRERDIWCTLQRDAMSRDCGWENVVPAYLNVYRVAAGATWPRAPGALNRTTISARATSRHQTANAPEPPASH